MDLQDRWNYIYKRICEVYKMKYNDMVNDYVTNYYSYITKQYTENRYYHTLDHIETMLKVLDEYDEHIELDEGVKLKIELGVWFHDIIYKPTQLYGENELVSANVFYDFMDKIGFNHSNYYHTLIVKKAILATTHTQEPNNEIEKILCDLDLCGFALDKDIEIAKK